MTPVALMVLSAVLLAVLLWLLFGGQFVHALPPFESLMLDDFLALHCRHFEQMGQVIEKSDSAFIRRRCHAEPSQRWLRERHRILYWYVRALAQDSLRLQGAARMVATLSREVTRKQEWEWFRLAIEFRLSYALFLLESRIDAAKTGKLVQLTDLLAELAAGLESLMAGPARQAPPEVPPSTGT